MDYDKLMLSSLWKDSNWWGGTLYINGVNYPLHVYTARDKWYRLADYNTSVAYGSLAVSATSIEFSTSTAMGVALYGDHVETRDQAPDVRVWTLTFKAQATDATKSHGCGLLFTVGESNKVWGAAIYFKTSGYLDLRVFRLTGSWYYRQGCACDGTSYRTTDYSTSVAFPTGKTNGGNHFYKIIVVQYTGASNINAIYVLFMIDDEFLGVLDIVKGSSGDYDSRCASPILIAGSTGGTAIRIYSLSLDVAVSAVV